MRETPTINPVPSQTELDQQQENMRAWIDMFEELAAFAKTTPGQSIHQICVYFDKRYLPGYQPKYLENLPGINDLDDLDEGSAMFVVSCGYNGTEKEKTLFTDVNFLFCPNNSLMVTYYRSHSKGDEISQTFERLVASLLSIEEISTIRQLNGYGKDSNTIELGGIGQPEFFSLKDGILILRHWIRVSTSEMKKSKPAHNPLPEEFLKLKANLLSEKAKNLLSQQLKQVLDDHKICTRARDCLWRAKITSVKELAMSTPQHLLGFRGFGKNSLGELEKLLYENDLRFGMTASDFE